MEFSNYFVLSARQCERERASVVRKETKRYGMYIKLLIIHVRKNSERETKEKDKPPLNITLKANKDNKI